MPSEYHVTAPTPTTSYRSYIIPSKDAPSFSITEERSSNGRACSQHRPVVMRTGVLSCAKGSAYVEYQNTKVICSVFDPREIPNKTEYTINGELYCEFKFGPFSTPKRRGFGRDAEEKEHSVYLRRALEPAVMRHQFSNFQVDIFVLVLENDGSCLAAAITCANLALANACVPMHDLVTAVSLGLVNDQELIDPTYDEELYCMSKGNLQESFPEHGLVTLSFMKTFQQVTEIVLYGVMSNGTVEKFVEKLSIENEKIYELSRQCLVRNILKTIKEKREAENKNADTV